MRFRPLFALFLSLFIPAVANAQWVSTGITVSGLQNDQRVIAMCSDGSGGAIIVWEDYRTEADIYAQRISATGIAQWTAHGVVVNNTVGAQYQPRIISDGLGGAIVSWMDYRAGNYDVYAQRINSAGALLWASNGVVVSSGVGDQSWPAMVSDGSSGAIIAWMDARNPPPNLLDIYAQRINASGVVQWTANGVAVSTIAADQQYPQITTDGIGGAIIEWLDSRNGVGTNYDIFAQRVASNGTMSWTAGGVGVCTAPNVQNGLVIISDGANGAITGWYDYRNGSHYDIYAQRINGAGSMLWPANGLAVCTMQDNQFAVSLLSDGSQGAFIAWTDPRNIATTSNDLYAQRIGAGGNILWSSQGIPIATGPGPQQEEQLISDGAGGFIVVWSGGVSSGEIWTQRVNSNGIPYWATDGVQVTTNYSYEYAPTLVGDNLGNVIVGWHAWPLGQFNGGDANVYATRIDGRFGYWGKPEPTLFAVKDVPNDQGGKVRVEWYASSRDQLSQGVISKYTIWRGIDQAMYANAVAAGVSEVNLTDPESSFSGKVVRRQKLQALDYFWELIGTQTAAYRYGYSFTAETTFDSTATNAATHRFQILAHGSTAGLPSDLINWPSNILTGRSVDNLAPPAPLFVTAQRVGSDVILKWNGVHVKDFDKYTVYRGTSTGVTPIPTDFLTDNPDTVLTDSSAPASALYYIVTATDVHQNQGAKSNEASVTATTNAGNLPPITALTVLQNHPNPFTAETRLQVGLPAKSDVRVEIYDVAGKRVRELKVPAAKGWNTLTLSARDDRGAQLPSGVYFFRVHAGAETVTKKMVVTR